MINVCLLDQVKKPQITGKILFWPLYMRVFEDEISRLAFQSVVDDDQPSSVRADIIKF